MINTDFFIKEWKVYDAEQFRIEFGIDEKRDEDECDEDYIMRHLENDERVFFVEFIESKRDNAYEEYWLIREVREE